MSLEESVDARTGCCHAPKTRQGVLDYSSRSSLTGHPPRSGVVSSRSSIQRGGSTWTAPTCPEKSRR